MQLLVVRHADAGDAGDFAATGKPDSQRPLSDKGREQMRDAAKGLVKLVSGVDLLVSSPYTRAEQTAEIVSRAYRTVRKRETTDALEPGAAPDAFVKWLRGQGAAEVVAAVGHEPHLGLLVTWLMTGNDSSRIEMKKGGACLLTFANELRKGAGMLMWLMGPKHLREL